MRLLTEKDKVKAESIRWNYKYTDTETLVGKEVCKIVKTDCDILLHTTDGHLYSIHHEDECCEEVYLADVCGDLEDLLFSEILSFEIVSNSDDPPVSSNPESYTWTFVKVSTNHGSVTMRWYGESNGYYGETVTLMELKPMIHGWGGNPRSDRTRDISKFIFDISKTGVS
jgi:hypothetical protein